MSAGPGNSHTKKGSATAKHERVVISRPRGSLVGPRPSPHLTFLRHATPQPSPGRFIIHPPSISFSFFTLCSLVLCNNLSDPPLVPFTNLRFPPWILCSATPLKSQTSPPARPISIDPNQKPYQPDQPLRQHDEDRLPDKISLILFLRSEQVFLVTLSSPSGCHLQLDPIAPSSFATPHAI